MIEKPRSDGTRQSSSFGGDLWNARRSNLGRGKQGESNPSRLYEPTGRWQRPKECTLSDGRSFEQQHTTLTAVERHGSVDSVKGEVTSSRGQVQTSQASSPSSAKRGQARKDHPKF